MCPSAIFGATNARVEKDKKCHSFSALLLLGYMYHKPRSGVDDAICHASRRYLPALFCATENNINSQDALGRTVCCSLRAHAARRGRSSRAVAGTIVVPSRQSLLNRGFASTTKIIGSFRRPTGIRHELSPSSSSHPNLAVMATAQDKYGAVPAGDGDDEDDKDFEGDADGVRLLRGSDESNGAGRGRQVDALNVVRSLQLVGYTLVGYTATSFTYNVGCTSACPRVFILNDTERVEERDGHYKSPYLLPR